MNTLNTKLDAARVQFLKHSGTAPQVARMLTLAWNAGAETMLKFMTEWTKEERVRLERINRRGP